METIAPIAPGEDQDRLLTQSELCALLGGIPARSVRKWTAEGTGPRAIRLGKYVRYRLSDVRAWIDAKAAAA
ncbi:MAG: helix-turn-helix domain-containing protein [Pseudonocardia sp.]|nr:helix-turn-helix domain-containing protein [Pseudonocardia sp.]